MSNNTSPSFLLLEETVTDIYTPENVKALALHVQSNFGESMAIEVAPYFFINPKSKNRTYYKYIGVYDDKGELKQNPFSGLNTTTISFAYLKKDYENIEGDSENKTFAIGARTTLIRFYNKKKVMDNATELANALSQLASPPMEILTMPQGPDKEEALKKFYLEKQKVDERFKKFQKTIKPIFKVDVAGAYSDLFTDNSVNSGTVNRLGAWLTGEFSLIINEDDEQSSTNNYINLLITSRYIEDGFNSTNGIDFSTNYYRDFGGKISMDLGKFSFAYEYINRNGSISSKRSVGNISFAINKDITLTGGFGKDFNTTDNLLTLFGINWGMNFGNSSASL
ncbi:hypothetical protein [Flavobacterium sp. JAS]|uniref:hypothetical protein n=1 Tax=Flavobacterium sp. JAS TaxID=2897329 RepID=UPI001E4845DE|nr:hypothetical protein [Flavobacterium sp. JAS]MCD0470799.1 hypothetical protein [Flavobacterium sp. JAS]